MAISSDPVAPHGWSIECRIASEDPGDAMLPSTGTVRYLKTPGGPGVRWDGAFGVGDEITLYYDSLLGKLIVWATDRQEALARMRRALDELTVVGIATNQGFHRRLFRDQAFCDGEIDIQFLDRRQDLLTGSHDEDLIATVAVAAALAEDQARGSRVPAVGADGWRSRKAWFQAARNESLR